MVDAVAMPRRKPERTPQSGAERSSPWIDDVDFLLRHAIRAPSSHNTQPWIFEVHDARIDVYADPSRWLRVADADQRELHVSIGCALENLILAAESRNFSVVVTRFPDAGEPDLVATLRFHRCPPGVAPSRPPELLRAVGRRRTDRDPFDGRPVPERIRSELRALATEPGVEIHFMHRTDICRKVEELTVRADEVQFADPAWREELAYWIGEGVFGTPWVVSKVGEIAVRHFNLARIVGKKDRDVLRSAPLLGVVTTARARREDRVKAGQVFERLFLAATNAGLALHPMNQVLQVHEIRDDFEALLPEAWAVPQMIFRLGRPGEAGKEATSPRRPLDDVVRWTTS